MNGRVWRWRPVHLGRPVVLGTCVLLAGNMLAACSSHSGTSAPPGAAPAIGPPPSAVLPAGEHIAVHVTAAAGRMDKSNDLLWDADRQIGPAYDFVVAKEPSSAVISFKVDPRRLPAAVGVAHAAPTGLFIQIYEPALATWIPLSSTYHPASHTVTATAPHLSPVGLAWNDLKCVVECPAKFLAKLVKRLGSDVISNLKQTWSPKQEPDECADKADKGWAVRSSLQQLSGCVIDSAGPVVQVENPLLLPMAIRQPPGAPHSSLSQQPSIAGGHPELTSLVTGLINWAADGTVIPPRSYGVVPLQDLSRIGSVTMSTQPDALGMVMDVILSVLFALPGEKTEQESIDHAVEAVLPKFEEKIAQGSGPVSLSDILEAVSDNISKQQETAAGPVLTFVQALDGAYKCANDNLGMDLTDGIQQSGITNGVFEAAANLAEKCVETSFDLLGKKIKHSFTDVLDLLDSFPNFGKTIREGVQFARLGPSAMLASTTAERIPYDLTKSPYFQTPDGNIACGVPYFKWWPHTPSWPSYIRDAVECRIVNHTVEPTNCRDLPFEANPAAYMQPGEYASFSCVQMEQDKPMDFQYVPNSGLGPQRQPYHAADGQNINLGPATCFVQTSSVDCTATGSDHTFHLDPGSFRSPLSPGDSVLAAQNVGGTPDTYASTGVSRPASYQWGKYSSFSDITWQAWGPSQATGTATYRFNTCTPVCAAGNYRTDPHVTISFTNPQIVCGGWFFTELHIDDPSDKSGSGGAQIAPDSYSPGRPGGCLPPSSG